jgi:hypothetical protein
MIAKDFTERDVDMVFDNLWPIGQEELLIFGSSIEKAAARFKSMVKKPWSTGFYGKDYECFALIIMEPVGEMKFKTQFAAIEEGIKANGVALTRFLKNVSDKIVNEWSDGKGEIELETTSDCDFNWFSGLGFTLVGTDGFIDKYLKKKAVIICA